MQKRVLIIIFMICILAAPVTVDAKSYTSKEEVYQIIRKNILAHKEKFSIEMNIEVMNEIKRNSDLLNKAADIDSKKTSKDGDYLRFSVSEWATNWQWYTNGRTADLNLTVKYRNTVSQEKKLDTEIKRVLKALKLDGKSDYAKVKKVHDYIIKKTIYDQTLKKHTAYDALIGKSAVCDGYTLAAYRLLTDAGVMTRVITGWAAGNLHSWNIVQVGDKWYNLDLTWDDPITDTGEQILTYDYFLKNNNDFINHRRDSMYRTNAFNIKYPIAIESYEMRN
ncbi:Transglutaminase-like superfamily protein [Anaerocolumna jejuensis DSM 15929]|uniref:Transglutaminase-like superfamily protein n=1 Tax=Anaerocolumna jejuensis DSM 15929 TaxID=1121322 RepID=A0A1M6VVT6_9FIRM|nr:transglutaminase domain-containing protein [Anaerocolumna jejuensis]SHK85529.1 Transglutaminase-like superfamily protein [Anaerocolumna jejuensis DSM 15929]